MAPRNAPDQRLTVNELNRHAGRELPRRVGEGTGGHKDAPGSAHFLHSPGELPYAGNTDLIDKPVLALHEDRGVLSKQDEIVPTVRPTADRLLDVIALSSVDLCNEVFEVLPAEPPDALDDREFSRGQEDKIVRSLRTAFHDSTT